ncbi:MAG: M1 family metallopeptidase, partial [Bacteroidia bacterium]|nr:M1 family metallopeptidase [Bacteroidia bacterium]
IQLNLHENLSISEIDFLYKGGKQVYELSKSNLPIKRKYNALWIKLPNTIGRGENFELIIHYGGKPVIAKRPPWEGGLVWKKDKQGRPWIGVACEQVGANLWWPLKDHLTAEPDSMQMTFIVPDGLTAVSNGLLINKNTEGPKDTFTYKVSYPINTYNATFYIGNFEHFSTVYDRGENKKLHFYVLDYNLEKAQEHFKQTTKIISAYERLFGEYPFWNDQYKLVESPFEGMEHQTAIAYGNGYKNNAQGVDYIILHESAHEWWGNAISVKDYADIWIHEGMATYSEALFMEDQFGYRSYSNYLNFYSMLIKNKRPMVGPKDVNFWNYKDSDPYMKGALMMHSLRNTINDDHLFFDIIKTFYQTYKYQTVTSKDFIEMVNQKTGSDYSWFFNKYLYQHQPPKLVYVLKVNEATNTQELTYRWDQTDSNFKMPIYIKAPNGSRLKITPEYTEKTYNGVGDKLIIIDSQCAYFSKKAYKKALPKRKP